MCLMFWDSKAESAANQGAQRLKDMHSLIKCDNVSLYYLLLNDDSLLVLCRLPIHDESGTARMAMYPLKAVHSGFMVGCDRLECLAPEMEGFTNPTKFVSMTYHDDSEPVYRSLGDEGGGEGEGGGKSFGGDVVRLPPAECVENLDGSANFTIYSSMLPIKTRDELAKLTMQQQIDYNHAMSKRCMDAMIDGMIGKQLDLTYMFDLRPGTQVPTVESEIDFRDQLLPNLRPGCDMLVCLPPIIDTGASPEPNWGYSKGGAFNVAFHFKQDALMAEVPLLGLVHNVEQGLVDEKTGEEKTTTTVEDNFYLYTNRLIKEGAWVHGNTGFAWKDRLAYHNIHSDDEKDAILKAYPNTETSEYGGTIHADWTQYAAALQKFQVSQALQMRRKLQKVVTNMGLGDITNFEDVGDAHAFRSNIMEPCIVNLKGEAFPNDAVSMHVREFDPDVNATEVTAKREERIGPTAKYERGDYNREGDILHAAGDLEETPRYGMGNVHDYEEPWRHGPGAAQYRSTVVTPEMSQDEQDAPYRSLGAGSEPMDHDGAASQERGVKRKEAGSGASMVDAVFNKLLLTRAIGN